mgnify:CR=1 FL=1
MSCPPPPRLPPRRLPPNVWLTPSAGGVLRRLDLTTIRGRKKHLEGPPALAKTANPSRDLVLAGHQQVTRDWWLRRSRLLQHGFGRVVRHRDRGAFDGSMLGSRVMVAFPSPYVPRDAASSAASAGEPDHDENGVDLSLVRYTLSLTPTQRLNPRRRHSVSDRRRESRATRARFESNECGGSG